MLFTAPDSLEAPKGSSQPAHNPSSRELHFLAQDRKTGELYGLTVCYLLSESRSIPGGTTHQFEVSKQEMFWLFGELNGDRITHYRRGDSRKKGYRPIVRSSLKPDKIILTSYYKNGRIAVDFIED